MDDSMDNEFKTPCEFEYKKRESYGRLTDVTKRLRAQTFEIGEDCHCKKECFARVNLNERLTLIGAFNKLGSESDEPWNAQSLYLSRLITINSVKRRRPRKDGYIDEFLDRLHQCACTYKVQICRDGKVEEIPICRKAFISLHGITKKRIDTIQRSLKLNGEAPKDQRGVHKNRPHKISENTLTTVYNHIKSFDRRTNVNRNEKFYLPEDLTIKKMYKMYTGKYKNTKISYETYRTIFNTKFNLSIA